MKKLIVEFLGTFFLVLAVAMMANPLAVACMLMAWIYIGGSISGAHYNPLVSLAVALRGRLEFHELPWYMGAQVLGGIAAYGLTFFLHGAITVPAPEMGVTLLQALIVELLLSFVFASIVLAVATTQKFKSSSISGFAIGFTIPALASVGGPISGGLFNPAIALGASVFGVTQGMAIKWSHVGMYLGGAFLGAALAAYVFNNVFNEK